MHFEETTKCQGRGNGLEDALRFFHTDVNEKKTHVLHFSKCSFLQMLNLFFYYHGYNFTWQKKKKKRNSCR